MPRRTLGALVAGLFFAGVCCFSPVLTRAKSAETGLSRFGFSQPQMGVAWKIVVYSASEQAANRAAEAAFARVAALNAILSDYEQDSELVRLSKTSPLESGVPVSAELWRVLVAADELARRTDGAFDVTVGPLTTLWRAARRRRELPREEKLKSALDAVGHDALILDPKNRTVRLTKPRMRLDLGGIAMGYAADEALQVLKEHGIHSAMVDASGDVVVSGPPPGSAGWRIGIVPDEASRGPTRFVLLSNAAVATSGDAYQFVEIGGRRYSHIVDPKTGLGLTDRSAVTVVAKRGIEADSLATAISVLGPEKGQTLAKQLGAEVFIVRQESDGAKTYESPGFKRLEADDKNATPIHSAIR